MKYLLTILLVILSVLLLGFAIKNSELVELRYYLGVHWQAPLSLMLLVSLLLGVIIGAVFCLKPIIRQRKRLSALERELKALKTSNNEQP